jgi:branched-chain amino acid transport system permease protein
MIIQFLLNGLITGLLYALLALSFSLVYNTTKIFHIAYAGILVSSSFIFYTFSIQLFFPFVVTLLLTVIVTGLLNVGIEKFLYQALETKKVKQNSILVASIGAFIILTNTIAMIYGNENKTFNNEIGSSLTFEDLIITQMQMVQFTVSAVMIGTFLVIINTTSLGIKIKALSNNPTLFQTMGHSSYIFRYVLFFISGVLAAIISLLFSFDVGFDPNFGMALLLNALVAMIIGGIGSFKGSVLGGLVLGLIQSISVYYFESRWETTISFIILIVILLFRPQGIFGEKQRLI